MAFSSPLSLALLFLLLATTPTIPTADSTSAAPSNGNATIYDILPLYGLPPGIFPDTVTSFILWDDGTLSVNLSGPCYVDFKWQTYYAPTIRGFLDYGNLHDISGIQVQDNIIWLFWYNVERIWVDQPPTIINVDIYGSTLQWNIDDFLTVRSCNKSSCRLCASIHQAIQWTKDFPCIQDVDILSSLVK